jgi:hypothetical protein
VCQKKKVTDVKAGGVLTGISLIQAEKQKLLFPPFPPAETKISGEFLKAFLAALESFEKDKAIPDSKRKLENYDIEFRQSESNYYVYFIPKKAQGEAAPAGGETTLGKWVTYEIRKTDFRVTIRQLYK